MRIVVVGGGRVGTSLATTLKGLGHSIVVIEADEKRAVRLSESSGVFTLVGDGSDVQLLDEADAGRADLVLAVTGRDEDNLVACQLARTAFACRRVFARLNNPGNEQTFAALEIPTVSVTQLMVDVIHRKIDTIATLISDDVLPHIDHADLVRVKVRHDAPIQTVAEVDLPGDTLLVAVERQGKSILPNGSTQIEPGDLVIALARPTFAEQIEAALHGDRDVG